MESINGSTVYVSDDIVSNGVGDYPLYASGANSVLATNSEYLRFESINNFTSVATAIDGGALVVGGSATLAGSGSTADTVSLDNGSLTATDVTITSSGTGSWGINAENGAKISLDNTEVNASGSSTGSILLGNNSVLNATAKSKIAASEKAIALQLKADSTDSKAKAELTDTTVISQNNSAISVENGNLNITGGAVSSTGENSNAISAGAGAMITATSSRITTQGNGSDAIRVSGTSSSVTAVDSTLSTSGTTAHVINNQDGGTVRLAGGSVKTTKSESYGLFTENATTTASNVKISTAGDNSVGAYASREGYINLTSETSIETVGSNSAGIVSGAESYIIAKDMSVTTQGANSTAALAEMGTVEAINSTFNTSGERSVGLSSTAGTLTAESVTVTTTGDNAAGVAANAGTVTLTGSDITTAGAGSAGIFSAAAGSVTTDGNVTTTGADAYAVSVNQGSVIVNNGMLKTSSAAGIFAAGNDAASPAGNVTLTGATVDAAQSSVLSQGGMLDVTATGTTFNSGTGLVLDVQTDTADLNSTVNLNADSSTLNGSLVSDNVLNTSNVTLKNGSTLTGYSQNISSIELDSTSNWNLTANSDVQSLTNNGTITFNTPTSGDVKTLTVNGDYSGNGGTLIMNTQLGDDSSPTDKLVVTGNVNAGDTLVAINNLGGSGAYTVEGIQIVSVGGVSEGTFTKSGRIVAGAYDYNLEKINQSWYLTNKAPDVTDPGVTDPGVTDPGVTDPGITDPGVTDPGVTDPGVTDPEPGPDGVSQYRPETGSYLANMLAANTMFDHRMQDRLGEGGYARSAEGAHADGLWMRHVGSHNRFYDESGQLKARTNRYVLQLGVDLAEWSSDGYDRWHVGVMGGYGNAQSNIRSGITGYRADSKVEGYSAGVYATWVESDKDMSGAYVDSWVLYNWFRNTINGEALATEKYDSKGFTASLEAGYTVPMTKGERVSSWLQPKVQLTWMDVGADNHREHNGTWVTDDTDGMLRSRVGVRAYLKGHSELDNNTGRDFQPFVEANWLHNFGDYSVKMDDVTNSIAGDKNVGELKLGVEGKMANDFTMWGNVAQQVGSAGYSDTTVMFGARVNF
ncbi:autotransporter outer membrane beta-barrel domain-containing protein [Enterobacteriaceae bacterium 4M9]|nr:autotransporter outer membrane beta-barrel domain-containing protein [Enterobacteriaceae bacterium 4M9]